MTSKLLEYINTIEGLPCVVSLEMLSSKKPAMSLQQLPGEETIKAYINGDRECRLPFAIYMRISGKDTKSRINAVDVFRLIEETAKKDKEKGTLPFKNFNMAQLPALYNRQDDGTEDYQAIYSVDYYKERVI